MKINTKNHRHGIMITRKKAKNRITTIKKMPTARERPHRGYREPSPERPMALAKQTGENLEEIENAERAIERVRRRERDRLRLAQ